MRNSLPVAARSYRRAESGRLDGRWGSPQLAFGALEGVLLDEDPLPLVTLAGAAKANDDRTQVAPLLCAPRERCVARRKEDEVVHLGAVHATVGPVRP